MSREPLQGATAAVLIVPPFAEEMNKSRRMITQVASRLAEHGIATVLPDLYGTGDSDGDFAEADWIGWREDLRLVCRWCDAHVAPVTAILAIRLGCALAVAALDAGKLASIERTVLWQPVFDGKRFLGQLLRLRQAANLMSRDSTETPAQLRARLAAGETLEVAGYGLSSKLAEQLDGVAVPAALPATLGRVRWLELVREAGAELPPPSARLIDATRKHGIPIDVATFTGEPFWAAVEIASNEQMIDATVAALSNLAVSRATERRSQVIEMSTHAETSITFACNGVDLVGVLHRARGEQQAFGVVIIVGGPQYRVGSHRQFVLQARALAAAGYPVLRFDYRGMGDSGGEPRTFESIEDDVRAAIDALLEYAPALRGVFLFGLCDAASAALMYASSDARVSGLIVANPWVRTSVGQAKTIVRHYYAQRFLQRSFWKKVFAGDLRMFQAVRGLVGAWRLARQKTGAPAAANERGFLERMLAGLEMLRVPILILISEHDLTAQEFTDLCKESPRWARACSGTHVRKSILAGADHTFSSHAALSHVNEITAQWLGAARQG